MILAGIGIGVGAYRAGEDAGITQGIEQVHTAQETGQEVQVVHTSSATGRAGSSPSPCCSPWSSSDYGLNRTLPAWSLSVDPSGA
jgi:hypothetical protein